MLDASEWTVVSARRESPGIPQFVPVESVMRGSLWGVLGQFCSLAGILAWRTASEQHLACRRRGGAGIVRGRRFQSVPWPKPPRIYLFFCSFFCSL